MAVNATNRACRKVLMVLSIVDNVRILIRSPGHGSQNHQNKHRSRSFIVGGCDVRRQPMMRRRTRAFPEPSALQETRYDFKNRPSGHRRGSARHCTCQCRLVADGTRKTSGRCGDGLCFHFLSVLRTQMPAALLRALTGRWVDLRCAGAARTDDVQASIDDPSRIPCRFRLGGVASFTARGSG